MDILGILIWTIAVLIGLIFVGVVGLVIYARWYHGTLEQVGIPVIKPHWFLGSNPDAHKRIQPIVDLERAKKYGHVYGVSSAKIN